MGILNFLKRKKDDDFESNFENEEFMGRSGRESNFQSDFSGTGRSSFDNSRRGFESDRGLKSQQTPQIFGVGASQETSPPPPQPAPRSISFSQEHQQYGSQRDYGSDSIKDKIEVLSSKIDLIKNSLDNLNQRLDRIENYFMRR